jgi:hypothetical protein
MRAASNMSLGITPKLEHLHLSTTSERRGIEALFGILQHSTLPALHTLIFTFGFHGRGPFDLMQPLLADRLPTMVLPEDLAQRLRCVRVKFDESISEIRGYSRLLELLGAAGRAGVFEDDFGAAQVVD